MRKKKASCHHNADATSQLNPHRLLLNGKDRLFGAFFLQAEFYCLFCVPHSPVAFPSIGIYFYYSMFF